MKNSHINVDEIDTRVEFHQCSTYYFYACRSQKRKKNTVSHKYLFTPSGSTSAKAVRKTLVKLTPGGLYLVCKEDVEKDQLSIGQNINPHISMKLSSWFYQRTA